MNQADIEKLIAAVRGSRFAQVWFQFKFPDALEPNDAVHEASPQLTPDPPAQFTASNGLEAASCDRGHEYLPM